MKLTTFTRWSGLFAITMRRFATTIPPAWWYCAEQFNGLVTQVTDLLNIIIVSSVLFTIGTMAIACETVTAKYNNKWNDWRTACIARNCDVDITVHRSNESSNVGICFSKTWVACFQRWYCMYSIHHQCTSHNALQHIVITKSYGYLSCLDYIMNVSKVIFIRYQFITYLSTIPPLQLQKALLFLARRKITHYWLINDVHFMHALQPIARVHEIHCRHVIKQIMEELLNQDIARIILMLIY